MNMEELMKEFVRFGNVAMVSIGNDIITTKNIIPVRDYNNEITGILVGDEKYAFFISKSEIEMYAEVLTENDGSRLGILLG